MSRLPFELFLALRYLRPKRTFVSVITLISVIGVMLGVAVLIIVICVMSGFDEQTRDRILGFESHLRIMKHQSTLGDYEKMISDVSTNEHVKGVAPFVLAQVLLRTQTPDGTNSLVSAPWMRGIAPEYETNVSNLSTNVKLGEFSLEGNGVLIGAELAHAMELNVGDRVSIYSPATIEAMEKSRGKENEVAILPDEFVVRGIFDVGYNEYNANVIVVSLESAQELYRLNNTVHGLMVMLDDPFLVEPVRAKLTRALSHEYYVVTWMEKNSALLNAIMVEKNVMFYLLFFIVIVAAFGIMNSQITFVVQKTREIGVLKAIGAPRRQILWLFLSQSLVVGAVGVTFGFGLGMLALSYRNEFLMFMRRWTGFELFPASVYNFTELPALIDPKDIVTICGGALVICVLAGLVPALNAARLRPVQALRYE